MALVNDERDDFALRASGLCKNFSGFTALDNVNLNVRRGSIHALIGPNGAGKTTCFNLLTKFLKPSAGQIHFNGNDVTEMGPAELARLGVVRSFQISSVFPDLTALENVRVALQRSQKNSFSFWQSPKSLASLEGRAAEALVEVGLGDYMRTRAGELSYGRKRALELATTLSLDPEVMLLDEPMAGIGREDINQIASLIGKLSRKRTILMVEHNLGVVADLSDRVTVLARGRVLVEGTYADVTTDQRVRQAYLGSEHH